MPMYVIHVTEQPRTGQRKPRHHWFAVDAPDADAAVAAFRASFKGKCYGCGTGDTITVTAAEPDEVLILAP